MKLTNEMHDAVKNSEVGQYIDRLIRDDFERNQRVAPSLRDNKKFDGNVIQALWAAFMSGAKGQSFREIKDDIKSSFSSGSGSAVSGE